jgi:hypothetical protein
MLHAGIKALNKEKKDPLKHHPIVGYHVDYLLEQCHDRPGGICRVNKRLDSSVAC